jgi:hypothetical protein
MEPSGQLHAMDVYPGGKSHQYLLNMRLGGPKSQYAHFTADKNLLHLSEFKTCIIQPIVWSLY